VFVSYEAEVSNKRWAFCSREARSKAYRALSRLIISDAGIAIAVPTCGSTIAGIELSSFPAPHGESVSRVTLGADRKFLWWCLCPTSRHFSRALVARAAQPIDVLSCEGLSPCSRRCGVCSRDAQLPRRRDTASSRLTGSFLPLMAVYRDQDDCSRLRATTEDTRRTGILVLTCTQA
jgi:hypothetical protein